MTTYSLDQAELSGLLEGTDPGSVFAPAATPGLSWFGRLEPEACIQALSRPRSSQSPKGFFLPPAESVGRYGPQGGAATATLAPATVLVGVRGCELRARTYLDSVLLKGNFADPPYRRRREGQTIISCDCVDCTDSCFCTSVGGQPFPTAGFDVNLTALGGTFLAEVATERGRQWLGPERLARLRPATGEQLARRDQVRREMVERLQRQNAEIGLSADDQHQPVLPDDDQESWQRFAADCVECGACTNICPTCHCFYLYDQSAGPEQFERVRTWDSCLLSTYHRMAGGAGLKLTPRPRLRSRLANRVLHKFAWSPTQYGLLGCVGCGRCVDACVGAIDIRRVVKDLGT